MARVLVTGGTGQLARALHATWPGHDLILLDETELDLGSPAAIADAMACHRPGVVINCAAFTQVDLCEARPEEAMGINGAAVGVLAEACGALGAGLVQISTDYVFDGTATRPYRETDAPNPLSVYGRSKLEGERQAARCPRHLVVRTSWLYDAQGRNFLRTMLDREGTPVRIVDDQRGAPTSCRALARQLHAAVEEGWQGLVHATCTGETTWYGFARRIFEVLGVAADVRPCSTAEYPTPARRPAYSVLDGSRRALLGTDLMPPWEAALDEVLDDL